MKLFLFPVGIHAMSILPYCHLGLLHVCIACVCLNIIVLNGLALNLLIFKMHAEKSPMTMLIVCFGHVPW